MPDERPSPQGAEHPEVSLGEFEHPRGTLVIVVSFGLLFGLAWLIMYLFEFLKRGATHA